MHCGDGVKYQYVEGWCQSKWRNLLFIYTDRSQGSSCSLALQLQLDPPPNSCSNLRFLLSYLESNVQLTRKQAAISVPLGEMMSSSGFPSCVWTLCDSDFQLCFSLIWGWFSFFISSIRKWWSNEFYLTPQAFGQLSIWPEWAGPNSRGFEIVKFCYSRAKMPSAVKETESKSMFLPDNNTCHMWHSVNNVKCFHHAYVPKHQSELGMFGNTLFSSVIVTHYM